MFIKEVVECYEFDIEKVVFVGFLNGSNIVINLMLCLEVLFKKVLLYVLLYLVEVMLIKNLLDVSVLFFMGKYDLIVLLVVSE